MDLTARAREFAVNAHTQIGHRRKYTGQPYEVHLAGVARLVASVSTDLEMVAAAWLHDAVEDTTATLADVEKEFGAGVGALVEELTDISKPGDGSRTVRKEIDRKHLAGASPRAMTIKLADLIDNARDIVKHDPNFARVYLKEMTALLEILQEGDSRLYQQACRVRDEGLRRILQLQSEESTLPQEPILPLASRLGDLHLRRVLGTAFTAGDIARPLRSFDVEKIAVETREILKDDSMELVCLRINGLIKGYAWRSELVDGLCGEHFRPFRASEVVASTSPPAEVIHVLTLHPYVFVTVWGEVHGVISRGDINKPIVRMWLFGIVTVVETALVQMISEYFPDGSWSEKMTHARLQKALALQKERKRRQQNCRVEECLQFSDKAQLLIDHPEGRKLFGFSSKRDAQRAFQDLESLRNNLAHSQDIATHDWGAIARLAARLEALTDLPGPDLPGPVLPPS
jgi:hypothetical protein